MDGRRFDQIVRALGSRASRRTAIGGAVAAGIGARALPVRAAAGCCKCSGSTDCQDTNSENACKQVCGTAKYTFLEGATCTNKKCVKKKATGTEQDSSTDAEGAPDADTAIQGVDWITVNGRLTRLAYGFGLLPYGGVQIGLDPQWAASMGLLSAGAVEALPADWSGVMQQNLYSWVPDGPGGNNFDAVLSMTINAFSSVESAKTFRRFVRDEFERMGFAPIPEDVHGVRGMFLYDVTGTMNGNAEIPQRNTAGVLIGQGSSVLSIQIVGIGADSSVTDAIALARELAKTFKQEPQSTFPLIALTLPVAENTPGFNLVIPAVDGEFVPFWGGTDSEIEISRSFAGDALIRCSLVQNVVGPDGSSYYLRRTTNVFEDASDAERFWDQIFDLISQSDSAGSVPPERVFGVAEFNVSHTLRFSDGSRDAGVDAFIFPGDEQTQYPGIEVALLDGPFVRTLALYGPDPRTFQGVEEFVSSEAFDAALSASAEILAEGEPMRNSLGFPTFAPLQLQFSSDR